MFSGIMYIRTNILYLLQMINFLSLFFLNSVLNQINLYKLIQKKCYSRANLTQKGRFMASSTALQSKYIIANLVNLKIQINELITVKRHKIKNKLVKTIKSIYSQIFLKMHIICNMLLVESQCDTLFISIFVTQLIEF